jgi:GntR family transcriptional repressor for pyruvate dehydrogenase complex
VEPSLHGLRTVRRVSPTQQVREQLLSAIQRGHFPPGSLLPSERVLCDTFGVSRVSVREAIAGLEAMGFITVQHGRGAFVRETVSDQYAGPFGGYLEMYRDELLDLLKVRGALDELSAEEAALRGTQDGIKRMVAACGDFRSAAERDEAEYGVLSRLDVAFHVSIAEAVGGHLMSRLLSELNGILEESRRLMLSRPGQLARSVKQHQAIVDAVVARDARSARRAARKHLTSTRQWIEKLQGASSG